MCYSLILKIFVFLGYCCGLCHPKNIADHPSDYVHLFTLNLVFIQGHSKSAAPAWSIQTIYGTPQATCVVICISNPWSKLS